MAPTRRAMTPLAVLSVLALLLSAPAALGEMVPGANVLYIAGNFAGTEGESGAVYLAYIDSASAGDPSALLPMVPVQPGLDRPVMELNVFRGDLIVAGEFTSVGGLLAGRIASWNGSHWSTLGAGANGPVLASTVDAEQNLVVVGMFTAVDDVAAASAAVWNGERWAALGQGIGGTRSARVEAATTHRDGVYVGGYFSEAGGLPASNVAQWTGTAWAPLGTGTDDLVKALTSFDGFLFVGGQFATAGGVTGTALLARWDGYVWRPVGAGLQGHYVAAFYLDSRDTSLVIGGDLSGAAPASGVGTECVVRTDDGEVGACKSLLRWTRSVFSPIGSPTVGEACDRVVAVAAFGNGLAAACDYHVGDTIRPAIAYFDEPTSAWSYDTSSLTGTVTALFGTSPEVAIPAPSAPSGGGAQDESAPLERWAIAVIAVAVIAVSLVAAGLVYGRIHKGMVDEHLTAAGGRRAGYQTLGDGEGARVSDASAASVR